MDSVKVYIDFKSPYSYVAVRPLIEFAQSESVELDWKPFTLKLERSNAGGESRVMYSMQKIRYLYMDVRRFANPQGLTIKGPQRIFDATISSIGMLYAQRHAVFEAYRDAVFERFFKRELDLDSAEEIAAVISSVGAQAGGFAAFLQGEGRQQHAELMAEAERAGVFGVPSMVYRGELFWGADRIELLRQRAREHRAAGLSPRV